MAFVRPITRLKAQSSSVVGASQRTVTGTGVAASQDALVAGFSARVVDGTGVLTSGPATVAGSGLGPLTISTIPNITLAVGETHDMQQYINDPLNQVTDNSVTGLLGFASYNPVTRLLTGVSEGTESGLQLEVSTNPALSVNSETFHSIGITWELGGAEDLDFTATVAVRYRKRGEAAWKDGSNLIRNEWAWYYGPTDPFGSQPTIRNFAGSLMYLTPGAAYDVELTYDHASEPTVVHNMVVTMRAIPVKPTAGNDIYVDNSHGGPFNGTDLEPYNTIQIANDNASPGDRIKIRTGSGAYAGAVLTNSGEEGNHIVYEPEDDLANPILRRLGIDADHIWIDALAFQWDGVGDLTATGGAFEDTSAIYAVIGSYTEDIIVTDCNMTLPNTSLPTPYPGYPDITGQHYANGVFANQGHNRWVVMDNDIVGMWRVDIGDGQGVSVGSTGNGIRLGGEGTPGGTGCVAAYNTITRVTDGVDIGPKDIVNSCCDVFSNQFTDTAGNPQSFDASWSNMRSYGNRATFCAGSPMGFQPQKLGPWYYCYNQFGRIDRGVFKERVGDRMVFINNTFVDQDATGASIAARGWAQLRHFSRNNLWISTGDGACWNSGEGPGPDFGDVAPSPQVADWRCDIDYDGFDKGTWSHFFYWQNNTVNYATIAAWSDYVTQTGTLGVSCHENSIEVDAATIFATYNNPLQITDSLELDSGVNSAVDAGEVVPNLSDFHGGTPDLGAHQRGATPLYYGVRVAELSLPLDQRTYHWIKH